MHSGDTLIQLPSKDLWRGFNPDRPARSNVDMTPAKEPTAAETMAKSDGSECLWCGMKFDGAEASSLLKAHVESLHFIATNMKTVAREFLTGAAEISPPNPTR